MNDAATDARTLFVTSADGTRIAYDVTGSGPALVIVDGALCSRSMGPSGDLAGALGDRFTVYRYDRRDRGESDAGASPYALEREVEDLVAVLEATGDDHPHVLAVSSGVALTLEAVRRGAGIGRLVGYEVPFVLDDTHPAVALDLPQRVRQLVQDGRRGDAVATFLKTVGAPAPVRVMMRALPVWRKLTAVAHTLPYDLSLVVPFSQGEPLPAGYYDEVRSEVLMVTGGKSPSYMRNAQSAVAQALPRGELATLAGQTHMVRAEALAPLVIERLLAG